MEMVILSLCTFLSTLFGGIFSIKNKDNLHKVMGFTAGVLVGVVFFEIFPEIIVLINENGYDTTGPMIALVLGFLVFHILEKTILIHHSHEGDYSDHKHPKVGIFSALALAGHSFMDGVGIGESRQEAMRDYETQLNDRGNIVAVNKTDMELENTTSLVQRFGSENIKGTTFYYFILSNNPKQKFFATSNVSTDLALTREGDKVSVQYVLGTSKTISIMKFKNLTIGITDEETELLSQTNDSIKISKIHQSNEKVVEQKWEDLSIEEKKNLMKKTSK
jgi:hypothetical protein